MKKGVAQPGYVIEHPNREKASSKATKAIVILLLLVSAALMIIITLGGWETLQGAKSVQIAYILIYFLMAYYIARWKRGLLPVASALSIILLIFAAVSGPEWFDRDKDGFDNPPLDENIIGLLTYLLVPVQILTIFFAMRGFQQAWNVEVERPAEGGGHPQGQAQAQPA